MITFEIRMEIKVLHKRGMSIRAIAGSWVFRAILSAAT